MNRVILLGRLTREPEVKMTASQVSFCNFSLAVDRRYKDANGQRQADFINCVAWRQTAQFIGSYFHKGSKILVGGTLQSRTYDDANGQKRYVTEVVIDEVDFAESARSDGQQSSSNASYAPSAPTVATVSTPVAPSSVPTAPVAPATNIEPDFGFGLSDADDGDLPFVT